jgi:hypothetical protein
MQIQVFRKKIFLVDKIVSLLAIIVNSKLLLFCTKTNLASLGEDLSLALELQNLWPVNASSLELVI